MSQWSVTIRNADGTRHCASRGIDYCGGVHQFSAHELIMKKSYHDEPKTKRHVTLTQTASDHLDAIAKEAGLSRSEAIERLIRSMSVWEAGFVLSEDGWSSCVDHTNDSSSSDETN
jgi:hypothetical protein